ncbi:MAG: succinylglutamate desuccinylase/aspartoacylase family protein [Rickettsiales bacterium]|nr:succinylglutamate desuccinylase/aspartoacylase family protein [Rickettsiales bacterium]
MLEIIEFKSINKGKNILITGAVHGNEICGTKAINSIINKIKSKELILKSGNITFIPITNPEAYKQNKRFYEINLNRTVKKNDNATLYEEKIGNILTEYIEKNDYHLDLHSMHKNNQPMLFQDYKESADFVKNLGLEYVITGWPEIYQNDTLSEDFSTQAYGHKVNIISCTAECGSHNDPESVKVAEQLILNALSYLNIIDYKTTTNKEQKIVKMEKVIFKEFNGSFTKDYNELDIIKKGDIIATYNNGKNIIAEKDYHILLPNKNANINEEWFYLCSK